MRNPLLICCHPIACPSISSSLQITNRSFRCITLPVESVPLFVPSASFCSLSSWFTSSSTHHLITVPVSSLPQSITPWAFHSRLTTYHVHMMAVQAEPEIRTMEERICKHICFANPFRHSLSGSLWTAITNCLTRSLGQDLLCFSFFAYIFYFVVTCAVLDKADWPHCMSAFQSTLNSIVPYRTVSYSLTLWRPLLPYGYSYKASCVRPG